MLLWQKRISTCTLTLFKSRGNAAQFFDIDFCGLGTGGMLPKFLSGPFWSLGVGFLGAEFWVSGFGCSVLGFRC